MSVFPDVRPGAAAGRSHVFMLAVLLLPFALAAQQPQLVVPLGHGNKVTAVSFSPDGKRLLTSAFDNTAKLWDVASGKLLASLNKHAYYVLDARFNQQGTLLFTRSMDGQVWVWDQHGNPLFTPKAGAKILHALFSPQGDRLVTATTDSVQIWDAQTGNRIRSWLADPEITSIQLTASGRNLIVTGALIQIYDCETGQRVKHFTPPKAVVQATYSPKTHTLATWLADSTLGIWKLETGRVTTLASNLPPTFGKMAIHPGGNYLVAKAHSDSLYLWNLDNNKRVARLANHADHFARQDNFQFSAEGNLLYCTDGTQVRVVSLATGAVIQAYPTDFIHHREEIYALALSADQTHLATLGLNSTYGIDDKIKIWNLRSQRLVSAPGTRFAGIKRAWFSTDAASLVLEVNDRKTGFILKDFCTSAPGTLFPKAVRGFSFSDPSITTRVLVSANKITVSTAGRAPLEIKVEGEVRHADYDAETNRLAVLLHDQRTIKIFQLHSGELLTSLQTGRPAEQLQLRRRASYLVVQHADGRSAIVQAATGKLVFESAMDGIRLSHQSDHFIEYKTRQQSHQVVVRRLSDAAVIRSIEPEARHAITPFYFPDDKLCISVSGDPVVTVWDVERQEPLYALKGHSKFIADYAFSSDNTKLYTASYDGTAKCWNMQTGALLYSINAHSANWVHAVALSADGDHLVTTGSDYAVKLWKAKDGAPLASLFVMDSTEYLMRLPNGYYHATGNAARKLHYVDEALNIIGFDQLDVKYNRPDKVLAAIGCADTALINSYRRAYEKRIRKLGIDTTAFRGNTSVPEVEIINRDAIGYEQKQKTLSLHIRATDKAYALDRVNVWVNEVPLFGMRGISLRNRNRLSLDTVITISLSDGENSLETSVLNINGIESYRKPLLVSYIPKKAAPETLYFIGLGINTYAQHSYNLRWSIKDIRDQALALKQKYGAHIFIDTLFDQQVTVAALQALKKKLLTSGVNDKVIIAYSGHGLLSQAYDYYLATAAVNFAKPEEGGIPYELLEGLLDNIPARKKLLLIDACHSGEVDKEALLKLQQAQKFLDSSEGSGAKGAVVVQEGSAQLGMKNSFELMQELFVNVGRSTGATVISAAAGTQFAYERGELQNGVFSYSILEYMEAHPQATVSELKQWVNKRVSELTAGMQQPTTRYETNGFDWRVW